MIADDFEFDPIGAEDFTCHPGRSDRFAWRVTASGVGQDRHVHLLDKFPEILTCTHVTAFAPERNSHDFRL